MPGRRSRRCSIATRCIVASKSATWFVAFVQRAPNFRPRLPKCSARCPIGRGRMACSASSPLGSWRCSNSRFLSTGPWLVAEGIEKPGNLGAMLRSADATGAGVIVADPATDAFNPNVIRGQHRHPVHGSVGGGHKRRSAHLAQGTRHSANHGCAGRDRPLHGGEPNRCAGAGGWQRTRRIERRMAGSGHGVRVHPHVRPCRLGERRDGRHHPAVRGPPPNALYDDVDGWRIEGGASRLPARRQASPG